MGLVNVYKMQRILPYVPFRFSVELWPMIDAEPDPTNNYQFDVKSVSLPIFNLSDDITTRFGSTQFNIPVIKFNEKELSITFVERDTMDVLNLLNAQMGFQPFDHVNLATYKIRVKQYTNDLLSQCVDEKVYLCRLKEYNMPEFTTSPGDIVELTAKFYVIYTYNNINEANEIAIDQNTGNIIQSEIDEIDYKNKMSEADENQAKLREAITAKQRELSKVDLNNAARNSDSVQKLRAAAMEAYDVAPPELQNKVNKAVVEAYLQDYGIAAFVTGTDRDAALSRMNWQNKINNNELTDEDYQTLFEKLNRDDVALNDTVFDALTGGIDWSDGLNDEEAKNLLAYTALTVYAQSDKSAPLENGEDIIDKLAEINNQSTDDILKELGKAVDYVNCDANDAMNEIEVNGKGGTTSTLGVGNTEATPTPATAVDIVRDSVLGMNAVYGHNDHLSINENGEVEHQDTNKWNGKAGTAELDCSAVGGAYMAMVDPTFSDKVTDSKRVDCNAIQEYLTSDDNDSWEMVTITDMGQLKKGDIAIRANKNLGGSSRGNDTGTNHILIIGEDGKTGANSITTVESTGDNKGQQGTFKRSSGYIINGTANGKYQVWRRRA